MKEPIVLRVYRGERLIAVKQFLSPQIVIGRQSDSGLSLDDESVAPIHAVIEKRGEEFYLSDLGSESGVTIEGTKVLESKIVDGECIGVGPYSVRFYIGVPKPPVPPDFKKPHTPPAREARKIEDVEVKEIDLNDKDEFPDLPLSPEGEITIEDEVSLEAPLVEEPIAEDVSTSFVDMSKDDEITQPEINIPVEVTSPGVHIATRDVDDTIDAQRSEPVSGGYLAPVSDYSRIEEIIDPHSRGSVLEVVVAWKERILKTYHFSNKREIYMSNTDGADIYVPIGGAKFKHKLVSFSDECVVSIAKSMDAQLYYDNKVESVEDFAKHSSMISPNAGGADLKLDQGQMVKLNALGDTVCIYIRFVEDTPKATTSPVFDFTSSEAIGIFMSLATIAILAMYMLFYVPGTLDNTEDLLEDRLKRAVITFNPPPRIAKAELPKVEPTPIEKPRITKVTEEKAQPKKVEEKIKKGNPKPKPQNVKTAEKAGKPKSAAPSRVKGQGAGSSRPGGSVNTGKKAANMETKKKDLSKTGILGVLSGGGKQDVVDKVSSGAGATIGMADGKTGFQGQQSDQKGDGIGTKLQKPGAGGSGSSLAGVGGLKTSGRGGNQNSYGAGGLGGKDNVTIIGVDGLGDDFRSSIDKDAIRRLIRKNKNAIKGCYDRALSQNKGISGKVVLSWKIAAGGKMISPKVKSSSLNNSQIEQCIINRLMVLKFPEPGKNEIAEVDYPFVFKAPN
jgi:outer membrane biosynthesis protein TonB